MNKLELRDATVAFDGNTVLDGASLTVRNRTVHGLVGQNGSGKSTLLKVLSGVYAVATGATLTIGGRSVALPTTPDRVRRHGLAIVPQDLGLAPDLSVLESIRLRLFRTGWGGRISWKRERALARAALDRYGVRIPLDVKIRELSNASRTVVAVLRALEEMDSADERNVLVLDEPTPHLTPDEVRWLFGIVRTVADEGTGVILVTHRLEEVFDVCDDFTVLRDGRVVLTGPVADVERGSLTRALLGYELEATKTATRPIGIAEVAAIRLEGSNGTVIEIRRGEVLGVTGLIGSGWERVPYRVFGADFDADGQIVVGGVATPLRNWTPRRAMEAGLALIPRDRPVQGAVTDFTLVENLTLLTLGRYFRAGWLRTSAARRRSQELIAEFDIRPGNPDMQFRFLSGGNQQKAILAKWWERSPTVILLDEPTQGIDVGARAKIYQLLTAAAESGAAVLVASVEYDELAKICHRVVVYVAGSPRVELTGDQVTQEAIVHACYSEDARGAVS